MILSPHVERLVALRVPESRGAKSEERAAFGLAATDGARKSRPQDDPVLHNDGSPIWLLRAARAVQSEPRRAPRDAAERAPTGVGARFAQRESAYDASGPEA